MRDPARLRVLRAGLLTTVQDLGRDGCQRFGMPVSGAMDPLALRLANRLVGNPDHAAALEATIQGPELRFETEALIAITGADLSPTLNGEPLAGWTAIPVSRGSTLAFGARRAGARAYLAVAGGLDTPLVLGSRSTHLGSRTGGLDGRALRRDDVLSGGPPSEGSGQRVGMAAPESLRVVTSACPTLRVILGPQADRFRPAALETLVTGRYTVSPQSDRMGFRLVGPALEHADSPDIVSEATCWGALQVPANQQPILLMADRQTTGGYPKLAVVASADRPLAAQLAPGDTLRFSWIDIAAAHAALHAQRVTVDTAIAPVA